MTYSKLVKRLLYSKLVDGLLVSELMICTHTIQRAHNVHTWRHSYYYKVYIPRRAVWKYKSNGSSPLQIWKQKYSSWCPRSPTRLSSAKIGILYQYPKWQMTILLPLIPINTMWPQSLNMIGSHFRRHHKWILLIPSN